MASRNVDQRWEAERQRLYSHSVERQVNYNGWIGRPPVFMPWRCWAAAAVLADGRSRDEAAAAAGVGRSTISRWINGEGSIGIAPRCLSASDQVLWSRDAERALSALRSAAEVRSAVKSLKTARVRWIAMVRRAYKRHGCVPIQGTPECERRQDRACREVARRQRRNALREERRERERAMRRAA